MRWSAGARGTCVPGIQLRMPPGLLRTASLPSPHVVLPCGSTGTTAASSAHPASGPLPGITDYRTPRSGSNLRRLPGRGGPPQFPPPLSIRSAPHTPGSPSRLRFQALHRFHGLHPEFGGSALPARAFAGRTSNDTAGFASCCGRIIAPSAGLSTLGSDLAQSRRAASLLPGVLETTRTGLPPAGGDELTNTRIHHGTTSRRHLLLCWAHESSRLIERRAEVIRYSLLRCLRVVMVTIVVQRDLQPDERALWDSLIPEFARETPCPQRVRLVIADKYEEVVGEYALQSALRVDPAATAAGYQSVKPGGAMAVAKTIDLPDDKVAVVVNAGLAKLGREVARRTLLHEAQHVRLNQNADSAMAVHKRVAFHLPADLTWEFIWLAESIVDEFRCERALYEKGLLGPGMAPAAYEYSRVTALFDEIWESCDGGAAGLNAACHRSFAVLERFGTLLAYVAASMIVRPGMMSPWTSLTPAAGLVGTLTHVPATTVIVHDQKLASISLGLAWFLREAFQEMGFDFRLLPDGSKHFELLRRMD